MIYGEKTMEEMAALETAASMCAAARTAPKATGIDKIVTLVLTGEEKDLLASKMEEIYLRKFGRTEGHYVRDAKGVRKSDAIVLIGVEKNYLGLSNCAFCGFESCGANAKAGGRCVFDGINLGIAIGSAASVAADSRVDSRVLFSAGKAAEEMNYIDGKDIIWEAIPISIYGKSPFFDRDKDRPIRSRRDI